MGKNVPGEQVRNTVIAFAELAQKACSPLLQHKVE